MIFSRTKFTFVFMLSALIAGSTGSVFSMQQEQENVEQDKSGRLFFAVEDDLRIELCNAVDMKYDIEPVDFLGKSILDVLKKDEQEKVEQAFAQARVTKKPVEVSYELKGQNFTARITPLFGLEDKKYAFFVEVRES